MGAKKYFEPRRQHVQGDLVLKFTEAPRTLPDIPEEVSTTVILFLEISRRLLLKKLFGELSFKGYPNCHGVAQAYAPSFPNLEVVHGAAMYVTDRPRVTSHSWLRFKKHKQFGIDVAPFGAVPLLTSPTLLYFDECVVFRECPLPEEVTRCAEELVEGLRSAVADMFNEVTKREEAA